jgi:hypothetical protein
MAVDIDLLIKAKAVLGTAQTEITKFLDGVEKQTEEIGKSSDSTGQRIGNGFKAGFSIAAGAVTAFAGVVASATAAVVALGMRGSGLDDTRGAFGQLTQDVGGYEKSLQTLRKATDGVVTDTRLMEDTNKAFSLGLRLNQEQMQLTGETARILADRVGVDTADAYSTLTQVMATGKDMMLKQVGLNIDAKKATEDYARALGKEASELSETEQIAAKKNAVLAAMRVELEATGRASVDFADRIDQIKVGMQNFNDNLAVAIATSPVVNEAMGFIGDAIMGAFGDNQQAAVQTLTGYVNSFAIFLVDVASVAVSSAKYIVFAWQGLKMLFSGLMTVIFALAEGVNKSFAAILEGAAKIPGVGKYYQQAAADAREMALQTEGMRKSFQEQTSEALDNAGRQGAAFDSVNDKLGQLRGRMVEASKTQASAGEVAAAFAARQKGAAAATGELDKFTEAVTKKIREMSGAADVAAKNGALELWARSNSSALMKLATDAAAAGQALKGNLFEAWQKAVTGGANDQIAKMAADILKKQVEDQDKAIAQMNEKFVGGLKIRQEALAEADDLTRKRTLSAYDYQVSVIEMEKDAKIQELKDLGQATDENLSAVEAAYKEKMAAASSAHAAELAKMKAATNSWGNLTQKWLADIPGMLKSAFAGGGGFGGAVKGMLSGIGGDIGTKLFDGPNGLGQKVAKGLLGKVGGNVAGKIGGMVGMLGGPIGSILGSFAAKGLGKLFGGIFGGSKERKENAAATQQVKDMSAELLKTYGSMENLRALGKATGIDIAAGFGHQGKKGLEEFTKSVEQFKKKVEELKPAFNEWGADATAIHAKLPATLTPYLKQLEQMGLLTAEHRSELEKWSQDGVVDVEAMKAAADRYGISVAALGPAFQQGVANQNWQQIIDDLQTLQQGGADTNAVLAGMSDEISKLVQDSMQFGTTIPENMRPWIEQLAASGQLLDANGNKITDISKLSFGDSIISSLDKIIDRFDLLLQGLGLIPKAIDQIPDSVNIDVNYRENGFPGPRSESPEGPVDVPGAAAGGLFSQPTFRVVGESRPEIVGAPNVIVDALAQAMQKVGGMQGGGGNTVQFNVTTPIGTIDTIRQMVYNELGPLFLEWLERGGAPLTRIRDITGAR